MIGERLESDQRHAEPDHVVEHVARDPPDHRAPRLHQRQRVLDPVHDVVLDQVERVALDHGDLHAAQPAIHPEAAPRDALERRDAVRHRIRQEADRV